MSYLSSADVGCVFNVTGRIFTVNSSGHWVGIHVVSTQKISGRPNPGDPIFVLHKGEWKMATYKTDRSPDEYAGTEEFGFVNWFEVKEPSPEEVRVEKARRAKQKLDAWKTQAKEIPTEVLLDVIKERTKSQ